MTYPQDHNKLGYVDCLRKISFLCLPQMWREELVGVLNLGHLEEE